jgi:hypothetical protein
MESRKENIFKLISPTLIIEKISRLRVASVVYQNIYLADLTRNLPEHFLDLFFIGKVGLKNKTLRVFFNLFKRLLRALEIFSITDKDTCAFLGARNRYGVSYTA